MKVKDLIEYVVFGFFSIFSMNSFAQDLSFENKWSQINYHETNQNLMAFNEHSFYQKKWKFDFEAGLVSGPYVTQLKDVFKSLGLQGCYDTFFGQECYPKDKLALGFMISLSRDIYKKYSLGITATRSLIFGVEGFNNGIRGSIGNRVLTIAPFVNYSIKDYLILGIGPAFHDMSVRFSNTESSDVYETNTFTRIGFIAEIAGIYPTAGVVYGKVNLRYLYTGEVELGPFSINQQIDFPKSDISFNQILFAVGCGVRL